MDSTLPREFLVMGFRVERESGELSGHSCYSVYNKKGKLIHTVPDYTWAHWEREVELVMSR